MSMTSVMSVKEMIEKSFGAEDTNRVNFKLIQSTLLLLARQLRILERQVAVEVPPESLAQTSSSLIVTEVQAGDKKSKKKNAQTTGKTSPQSAKVAIDEESSKSKQSSHSKVSTANDTTSHVSRTDKKAKSDRETRERKPRERAKRETSIEEIEYNADSKQLKPKLSFHKSNSDSRTDGSPDDDESPPRSRSFDEKSKYYNILDKLEEQRELVLRVIHQRHDSREERMTSPTPMASMERTEIDFEKLLIVETMTDDGSLRTKKGRNRSFAIVSPQEFKALEDAIKELQNKFESASPDFPENIKLMRELREGGASLSDALSALQLSHRLDAAEKAIEKMTGMITDLAQGDIGYNFKSDMTLVRPESKAFAGVSRIQMSGKRDPSRHDVLNSVTHSELRTILDELNTQICKRISEEIDEIAEGAKKASEITKELERNEKLMEETNSRMLELESLVEKFIGRLGSLDAGFATQMSIYQEQLAHMQMDLESALEEVSEVMANRGGEVEVSTEVNSHIKSIQDVLDRELQDQKELFMIQDDLSSSLQIIRKDIELLRDTKADRDEVEDALRDKAGIEHLNGLVSHDEYYAFVKEVETLMKNIDKRFEAEETIWQQVIEDLEKQIHVKTDLTIVERLREDIKDKLQLLKNEIFYLAKIVGEPKAAAITRKLHRDAKCLTCAGPAHMDMEENGRPPPPPFRPPTIGAEDFAAVTNKADDHAIKSDHVFEDAPNAHGDHGVCYRTYETPNPNERTRLCTRYCGGSHTKMNNIDRMRAAITISPVKRELGVMQGTDGKTYNIDNVVEPKPCIPCNMPGGTGVCPHCLQPDTQEPKMDTPFGDGIFVTGRESVARSSNVRSSYVRTSGVRTISIRHSSNYGTSFKSCECSKDYVCTIEESMKGVKSEEYVNISPKENSPSEHIRKTSEQPSTSRKGSEEPTSRKVSKEPAFPSALESGDPTSRYASEEEYREGSVEATSHKGSKEPHIESEDPAFRKISEDQATGLAEDETSCKSSKELTAAEPSSRKPSEEPISRKASEDPMFRKADEQQTSHKESEDPMSPEVPEQPASRRVSEEPKSRKASDQHTFVVPSHQPFAELSSQEICEDFKARKAFAEATSRKVSKESTSSKAPKDPARRKVSEDTTFDKGSKACSKADVTSKSSKMGSKPYLPENTELLVEDFTPVTIKSSSLKAPENGDQINEKKNVSVQIIIEEPSDESIKVEIYDEPPLSKAQKALSELFDTSDFEK